MLVFIQKKKKKNSQISQLIALVINWCFELYKRMNFKRLHILAVRVLFDSVICKHKSKRLSVDG